MQKYSNVVMRLGIERFRSARNYICGNVQMCNTGNVQMWNNDNTELQ